MIGSKDVIKRIRELLGEIAHINEQKYGYILYLTDVDYTKVVLGRVKDEEDNCLHTVYFDVIYGDVTFGNSDQVKLSDYDYFELDKKFEEKVEWRINQILEKLNEVTVEEKETIETLERMLGD